jgi:hypothetical protein
MSSFPLRTLLSHSQPRRRCHFRLQGTLEVLTLYLIDIVCRASYGRAITAVLHAWESSDAQRNGCTDSGLATWAHGLEGMRAIGRPDIPWIPPPQEMRSPSNRYDSYTDSGSQVIEFAGGHQNELAARRSQPARSRESGAVHPPMRRDCAVVVARESEIAHHQRHAGRAPTPTRFRCAQRPPTWRYVAPARQFLDRTP